jgi:decaprenyl-phosphate phosphoribosyltransferase
VSDHEALGTVTRPENARTHRPSWLGHIRIARIDHWFKNVFVLPGIVAAAGIDPHHIADGLPFRIALGLLATCIVASSNYVINELMDVPFDRHHPTKHARPIPSGQVNVPLAYVQWIVLGALGLWLALRISNAFAATLGVLWIMGVLYNIPPIRTKDVPYLDVLSEAINNPIRLVAGWLIVTSASFPPISLLLSYWMIGCYFMALKRFAESRTIGDRERLARYRKSLAWFDERRLLVSIMFYGSSAMLFFGAFIMRYRLELILSFPLVALLMAIYLSLAFKEKSAVQYPEKLYREKTLMVAVVSCVVLMVILLFWNIPLMARVFNPSAPVQQLP